MKFMSQILLHKNVHLVSALSAYKWPVLRDFAKFRHDVMPRKSVNTHIW